MEIKKPEFGAPCNGCGFCCKNEVCKIGVEAFGEHKAPCVGLIFDSDENIYRCKLVLIEGRFMKEKLIAKTLGVGLGCDATDVI